MHHRSRDERKRVASGGESVAFLDDDAAVGEIGSEVALHHRESRHGRDDLGARIGVGEQLDVRGVVGLHVLHDEEIDLPVADLGAEVGEPRVAETRVDGVEDKRLLVLDDV